MVWSGQRACILSLVQGNHTMWANLALYQIISKMIMLAIWRKANMTWFCQLFSEALNWLTNMKDWFAPKMHGKLRLWLLNQWEPLQFAAWLLSLLLVDSKRRHVSMPGKTSTFSDPDWLSIRESPLDKGIQGNISTWSESLDLSSSINPSLNQDNIKENHIIELWVEP